MRYEGIITIVKYNSFGLIHKMIHHRAYNATACGDGFLGPGVWAEGCRGGFDFTCMTTTSNKSNTGIFTDVFLLT